jgi:hypothetical protein
MSATVIKLENLTPDHTLILDTGFFVDLEHEQRRAKDLLVAVKKPRLYTTFWNVFELADGKGDPASARAVLQFIRPRVQKILGPEGWLQERTKRFEDWDKAFQYFCQHRPRPTQAELEDEGGGSRTRKSWIGDSFVATAALEGRSRVVVTVDPHFMTVDRLLVLDGWIPH